MLNWVYVARKDLGRGIDTFSARGNIPDGYAEDLVNFDTSASGKLEKRRGYSTLFGTPPLRISNIETLSYSGTTYGYRIYFATSSEIDLSAATPGPIVVVVSGYQLALDEFSINWVGTQTTTGQYKYSRYFPTWTPTAGVANAIDVDARPTTAGDPTNTSAIPDALSSFGSYIHGCVWGITDPSFTEPTGSAASGLAGWTDGTTETPVLARGGNFYKGLTKAELDAMTPAGVSRAQVDSKYRIPEEFTPHLDETVASTTKLAPLFYTSNPGSVRDRGVVYDANVVNNYAKVTAVAWHSGSGYTDYTLTWASKTGSITLSTQVTASDKLTVSGLAHPQHTGSWNIVSIVSDSASTTVIRVNNTSVTSAAFDESGAAGLAGVFTDTFETSDASQWAVGDRVLGTGLSSYTWLVTSVSSTTVYVSGVTAAVTLSSGLAVATRRTSVTLPISTSLNLVAGDSLVLSSEAAPVKVTAVTVATTPAAMFDSTVWCTSAHGLKVGDRVGFWNRLRGINTRYIQQVEQTVDTVIDSHGFTVKDRNGTAFSTALNRDWADERELDDAPTVDTGANLITSTGYAVTYYTGDVVRIRSTGTMPGGLSSTRAYFVYKPAADDLQFMETLADALAGTNPVDITSNYTGTLYLTPARYWGECLTPTTVTLERAVTFEGGASATTIQVQGRWVPIEPRMPSTSSSEVELLRTSRSQHAQANAVTEQSPTSTALVAGSLYMANGDEAPFKFSGSYLESAGLQKWQALMFASIDTGASATISVGPDFAYTAKSDAGRYFQMDYTSLVAGDRVYDSAAAAYYTVTEVKNDIATEDYHVTVAEDISGSAASGTLRQVARYKYYARLNLVDANGYSVLSAPLQSEDFVVDYATAGAINILFCPPPAVGLQDFAHMELELYRTKRNGSLFYLVHRQVLKWDACSTIIAAYKLIVDATSDDLLLTPDTVNNALVQSPELANGIEPPPIGAHLSSVNNRLLVGNVKGWPEVDIRFFPAATDYEIVPSDLSGTIITFRKDSASSSTTSDVSTVQRYEFVTTTYTSSFTFVDADVNVGNDTITEAAHGHATGTPCTLSNSGGTLPGGLATLTTYYIIRVDANTIKLATSLANAVAGTGIDITSAAGGGTHTLSISTQGRPCAQSAANSNTFYSNLSLSAGDWVYLFHSTPGTNLDLENCGWFRVSSVSAGVSFTINNLVTASAVATAPNRVVKATSGVDIPVWIGNSGIDGNYNVRDGNPSGTDITIQAATRLAAAINASQRVNTIVAYEPWLAAYSGNDYAPGQLVVRTARWLSTTPEVVISSGANFRVFINDVLSTAGETAFQAKLFPSRLVRSYPNYPSAFDSPFASSAVYSDSIIDVNPADGAAITAIMPFFGESAADSVSQLAQYVLVFKATSVYVVNVETRTAERLDTRGQGCTAPKSIAATHNGVIFANASGVYRINRDLSMSTVGKNLTGYFRSRVNKTAIAQAAGFHDTVLRRYMLAIPIDDSEVNNAVLVYDYDREGKDQELGAWTTYEGYGATNWIASSQDRLWSSTEGNVLRQRDAGDATDYYDGASAIEASATLRAEDFDLPGTRKAIGAITTLVEMPETDCTGLAIEAAMNLSETFAACGSADLTQDDIRPVDTTPPQRRGTHVQLRYTHSTAGEGCVLTGVQYTVAQLSGKRVKDTGDV